MITQVLIVLDRNGYVCHCDEFKKGEELDYNNQDVYAFGNGTDTYTEYLERLYSNLDDRADLQFKTASVFLYDFPVVETINRIEIEFSEVSDWTDFLDCETAQSKTGKHDCICKYH